MEQPLPTSESKSQSVTSALRKLLDEREAKGIATYGRSLQTHNGRDAVRDLVEELIDGAQYALQWEIERADLLSEIDRLKRRETDLEVCVEYELAENSRLQQAHADLSGALAYERARSRRLLAERDDALAEVNRLRGGA